MSVGVPESGSCTELAKGKILNLVTVGMILVSQRRAMTDRDPSSEQDKVEEDARVLTHNFPPDFQLFRLESRVGEIGDGEQCRGWQKDAAQDTMHLIGHGGREHTPAEQEMAASPTQLRWD